MVELTQTARLKIVAETQGVDQATRSMEEFQAAQEKVGGSTISVARALERHRKSLDDSYNSFKQFENTQRDLIKAQQQGLTVGDEYSKLTAANKKRYEEATAAAGRFNQVVHAGTGEQRLARHELINLSRQIQDVGVGIVSGQSPFTILVQQGSQIADVFATSTGTLRGFFSQAAAGFMGFIASAAGVVTAIAAIGIAAAAAAFTYASGQRDIERALAATGRASGVTRDQINEIAVASRSGFGISISEAREAATAFAATGKVYADNVGRATQLVDLFARAGVGAEDSTKKLAAALVDPAKGALELNKEYRFLDATMLNNIRTMQASGDLQGAQRALIEGMIPKIREVAQHTGILSQGWTATTAAASNLFKEVIGGSIAARGSMQQLLEQQEKLLQTLEAQRGRPAVFGQLEDSELLEHRIAAARKEIERLKSSMDSANKVIEESKLGLLGLEADALARALLPGIQRIEEMTDALNKLREARRATDAANVSKAADTMDPVSGAPTAAPAKTAPSGAEAVLTVGLQQEKDKLATLILQAQVTQQIAAMYPGMTQQGALQLYNLQQQTVAAQSQGTAMQLQAQQQANINLMVAQGKKLQEATAIATAQTGLAQAQINAKAQQTLVTAQGNLTIAEARGGAEKIVAQEQVRIAQLLAQEVPLGKALQIAATERAAAEANVSNKIKDQIDALNDEYALIKARQDGTTATVKGEIAFKKAIKEGASEAEAKWIAAATRRNEELKESIELEKQRAQEEKAALDAMNERIALHNREVEAINKTRQANNVAFAEMSEKVKFMTGLWLGLQDAITGAFSVTSYGSSEIFTTKSGGYSQFDPAGYEIGVVRPGGGVGTVEELTEAAEKMWGPGGFTETAAMSKFGLPTVGERFEPTEQGRAFALQQQIESMLQQGGTLQRAFQKTLEAPFEQSSQLMQQIIALASPSEQAGMLQQAIERARMEPATLAREQLIKQLTDQLQGLTASTDSLNATLQALSPFYSQDPRTTKLGFRAGVKGNPAWMTGATNQTPLDAILGPGAIAPSVGAPTTGTVTTPKLTGGAIMLPDELRYPAGRTGFASGGSFIVPGGYSSNDNKTVQFPAASGEQVVVSRNPQNGDGDKPRVVNIDNRIVIMGEIDESTLGKFKVSRYQQGQRMRASMAE